MKPADLKRHASLPASPVPDDAAADEAGRILRKFRIIFNAVRTHFQQVEKQAGIGGAQVWALSVIRDQPGIGVTELGSVMDIHQSTASNLTRQLIKRGLIQAAKAPRDRRNVQLFIEPNGLQVLSQVPGPFSGVLPMAISLLPAPSLTRLDEDLSRLIDILQADESAGKRPLSEL